jgi:PBSX family phage portal protein
MSKNKRRTPPAAPVAPMVSTESKAEVFSFGEPTAVLDRAGILDYVEAWQNGKYYEPPVSFDGLAKTFRAGSHHSSAIYFKRNVLVSTFIPHKLLSRETFGKWAIDFLTFGNGYLERIRNPLGGTIRFDAPLAKYIRRSCTDLAAYFQLRGGWKDPFEFEPGRIFHLMEPDINQEVYGLPEYVGALHAAWLNESATLFRRRYYENGSHAGFILYMTDPANSEADVDALREAMKKSKGPGNFRNLFVYAPNGKKDGMQLIPVSEVAAKDEFFNIKNVTRDDLLAAHRVPPSLLGIVPAHAGGFGSPETASSVYGRNEVKPLQDKFLALNEWAGEQIVQFDPYVLPSVSD